MTEPLDRDDVIALLSRLGSDQDEEVLEAARRVHAQITAAGRTWENLLVPDEAVDDTNDTDDTGYQDPGDEDAEPAAEKATKNAESLTLIDNLLAKSDISADLREELEIYKADIAEGEFEEGDRRYVRAIFERLSKRR
jgi:hypothetical protein